MPIHASNSSEQQQAEKIMIDHIATKFNLSFDKATKLPTKTNVQPDAIDIMNKTIVEVYARIGKLKGAQFHKVKGDILKLIFIEKELKEKWKKILCFADDAAAEYARGNSWVAEAARIFDVEILVVNLPKEQSDLVISAQKRQLMVNPK